MPTEEEIEQTKKLLTLLKDSKLVSEYIKRYGLTINMKNIKEVKEHKKSANAQPVSVNPALAARAARINAINASNAATAAATTAGRTTAAAAGDVADGEQDPVFESAVICPVCGNNNIKSYELRAKSQQVVQTAFLVPIYAGAKGYSTVDYNLLAVTVCPKCLFASPDKKNFNYASFTGTSEEKSTLAVGVILSMKDKIEERKGLLPAAVNNDAYFKRERSFKVAIESYKLAMARAESEVELTQPYAYFKLGSYSLKIGHIMRNNGEDDTEIMTQALGHFEKSFAKSECMTDEIEMQVVYLIVALGIRLGDLNKANSYLTAFSKLISERHEQMKKNPALNTHWIEKWQDKARYLWEERENPDVFERAR